MISAFVFFLHFLFALLIFTKKWQQEGLSFAFLNLGLIAILFTVGWSITGMISKLFMEPEGLGIYLTRDDFSLVLLTAAEYFFYRMYYKEPPTVSDTEK
ncbi:MAG: hypothetical protein V3V72_07290 [Ignavibacteriaceae bacterium]